MPTEEQQRYLEPTQESGRAFVGRAIAGPIVMLNLLRFRDVADYSATPELAPSEPISGAEAYRLYVEHTQPYLKASGGTLMFLGAGGHFLIGPAGERWDAALLVRQRSVGDFLAFANNPEYMHGLGHRTAALEDSRLLPLVEDTLMSTDANKAIIRRHFDAIWNQGQIEAADEIVAPDYLSHFPVPGQPPGIAGFKYAVQLLRTSFPDLHLTVEDLIAEGDRVVARLTARGTHQATFRGIPPTGRSVTWTGIRIFRIAEGKIVEHWANWDDWGLMQQLTVNRSVSHKTD